MNKNPIGIFDSGIGGLSVFKELIELLPDENYIYFGDTVNLPYGDKTKDELINITANIFDFFKSKNVKAVVMACNTTSATTYDFLKTRYDFRIYPIVQTVSKQIAEKNYKRIGVFATKATINSHAYLKELTKFNTNIEVFEQSCPEWVNIVENELQEDKRSVDNIKRQLQLMLQNNVEKIILGCTHYPYLINVLSQFAQEDIFINPAKYFAQNIVSDLIQNNLTNSERDYDPIFYVSSNPKQFMSSSSLFYKVNNAQETDISKILTI